MLVGTFILIGGNPDLTVSPLALPLNEKVERTMDADEKNRQAAEALYAVMQVVEVDQHMIENDRPAAAGDGRNSLVEGRIHRHTLARRFPPYRPTWPHRIKMINGDIEIGNVAMLAEGVSDARLTATGGTVQ